MTSRQGPVAEFCAALTELRRASGRDVATVAREPSISKAQLYSIFNGEIKRPPDRSRVVGPLVRACADGDAGTVASWRRRHAVLVAVWEELGRRDRSANVTDVQAPRLAGGRAGGCDPEPRDIVSFTGRDPELLRLVDEAAGVTGSGGVVGICAIGGMAGIGKTALAVHAAHLLASRFPDGQILLSLHGHTPGHQPVGPADALAGLLQACGTAPQQIPAGRRNAPVCGEIAWQVGACCSCWMMPPGASRFARYCPAPVEAWC